MRFSSPPERTIVPRPWSPNTPHGLILVNHYPLSPHPIREPFLLSDFDLAEGNTDAGGRLSIDGTVRIPDLVMAPIAAPRVISAIATTTAAVAHLVDARAPYWLAPRHTDDAGDPPLPT
jgi:hypothetical protein